MDKQDEPTGKSALGWPGLATSAGPKTGPLMCRTPEIYIRGKEKKEKETKGKLGENKKM